MNELRGVSRGVQWFVWGLALQMVGQSIAVTQILMSSRWYGLSRSDLLFSTAVGAVGMLAQAAGVVQAVVAAPASFGLGRRVGAIVGLRVLGAWLLWDAQRSWSVSGKVVFGGLLISVATAMLALLWARIASLVGATELKERFILPAVFITAAALLDVFTRASPHVDGTGASFLLVFGVLAAGTLISPLRRLRRAIAPS